MNKEKTKKLIACYPALFRKCNGDIPSSFNHFGFECGSGWYDLINELCKEIASIVQSSPSQVWPRVVQVKEKFGGLRFYISYLDFSEDQLNEADQAVSKEALEKISQLIAMAESKSLVTCEDCGLPGKCYQSSWVHVKCPTCELAYQQKDSIK